MSAPSEKATDFNNNGEVVRPGISSAFLKAQDIRHVDAVEAESLLGFRPRNNGSGIWIPYHDSYKPGPLIVNGRPFGRLRLDKPTPGAKYLSPKEGGAQLYVPINAGPFGKQLVIAEGEFKGMPSAKQEFAPSRSAESLPQCRRENSSPPWKNSSPNGPPRLSIFLAMLTLP